MNRDVLLGSVMMIVGIVLFVPGLQASASTLWSYMLLPAAVLLTYGTYKVGTSESGRAV